jgi:hypothetical protein
MTSRRAVVQQIAAGILLIGLCGCRVLISTAPISTKPAQAADPSDAMSWFTRHQSTLPTAEDPFLKRDDMQPVQTEQHATADSDASHTPFLPAKTSGPIAVPAANPVPKQSRWQKTRRP